jgi:hypothetical protein
MSVPALLVAGVILDIIGIPLRIKSDKHQSENTLCSSSLFTVLGQKQNDDDKKRDNVGA